MARKKNYRPLNITYLILVEGTTELIYFQNLKEDRNSFGFTVKLKQAKYGNPVPLLEEALREQSTGVYQTIWCVYDCDVLHSDNIKEKFNEKYKKAQSSGIQCAESMPCIEVWFILHFGKPQDCYQTKDAAEKDLRKKYMPEYSKDQDWQNRNLYKQLKEKTKDALTNVSKLPKINYADRNTATSVHKLVQIFYKE